MDRRSFLRLVASGVGAALAASKRAWFHMAAPAAEGVLSDGDAKAAIAGFITDPPFSFTYDRQPSTVLLQQWARVQQEVASSDGRTEYQVTWTEPHGQLRVRALVVVYPDYEAIEWTVWFNNTSTAKSKRLSEVLAADTVVNRDGRAAYVLHHFNGSADRADDYAPLTSPLQAGKVQLLFPHGGRPSNGTWPYFNISWYGAGVMVALGWPGQWTAQLLLDDKQGLSLKAGMTSADPQQQSYDSISAAKLLDATLEPGEEVRLPLVVLMNWKANSWMLAQNNWRRWMVAFNLPRFGGALPVPILPTTGGLSLLPDQAQEVSAIATFADRRTTRDRGGYFTHWWVDAGWYAIPKGATQNWFYGVGDWFPDPERFPQGMSPTFSHAQDHDMKSLLWSEPERVMPGTDLYNKHRDWLIAPPSTAPDQSYLLDLGNTAAWNWTLERFDSIISNQGAGGKELDVFRHDFNMDPLPYWNSADISGRGGMTQVKHVMGYLAFWDELRRRHPDLWIDSCASGGRRNDLETMRRAVPLLRSDYQFEPTGNQSQTFGISFWLSYYGTGVGPQATNGGTWGPSRYVVRSSLAPCYASSVDVSTATDEDWAVLDSMNRDFLHIQDDLLYGDFYPLTEFSLEDDAWMALQFNRPAVGTGTILVFRRPRARPASMRFRPQGLVVSGSYRVENLDREGALIAKGQSLSESGLEVHLPFAPTAAILQYTLQPLPAGA
jgi:alpha-galactosidase